MNDQYALSKAILALRAQARTYWGDNLIGHYAADCEEAARQLFALQGRLSASEERIKSLEGAYQGVYKGLLSWREDALRWRAQRKEAIRDKMSVCHELKVLRGRLSIQKEFIEAAEAIAPLNLECPDTIRPRTVGAVEAFHRLEDAWLKRHGKCLADYPIAKEEAEG